MVLLDKNLLLMVSLKPMLESNFTTYYLLHLVRLIVSIDDLATNLHCMYGISTRETFINGVFKTYAESKLHNVLSAAFG